MKKGVIWIALSFLIVVSMVLASCGSAKTTSTTTTTTTTTSAVVTTTNTTTAPTSTTSSTVITSTATTTSTGNWWDSLGTPSYGSSLTICLTSGPSTFDDSGIGGGQTVNNLWEDALVQDDWTVNPSVFSYQIAFRPAAFQVGVLATDWAFTDLNTVTMHLRKTVYWPNVAPVNGRQFVASDVVYMWARAYLGVNGAKPLSTNTAMLGSLTSVTAADNFTVAFAWHGISEETIAEQMFGPMGGCEEAPEVFAAYTTPSSPFINDWHHAIGCGPFQISDYVQDSSLTVTKNPYYWGYDERHPKNQLPYVNSVKILVIPNSATSLAAIRTGKIDAMDNLALTDISALKQTNPEIKQITIPGGPATIDPRIDIAPFSDIRVRQAMQMAINLPLIAQTFYSGTASPYPATMTSSAITGWSYPYSQWPATLKATYDYNVAGAKALLAAAGYPSGFHTTIVASNVAHGTADLDLLQIVQSQWASVGITMDVQLLDPAALNTLLRSFKQDALAYGTKLGFTFPPLMGFRHWQSITNLDWGRVNDPAWDALYAQALAAVSLTDTQALVVAGNKYEAEHQWNISLCTTSMFDVCQPWLIGYNGQTFAVSSGTGVLCMGFYCSRFWINQDLKNTYGH
jgi:peptide/nickel transport system substrate-binding protein